jgi:TRAP-type C4-dicarboxylate transport system substrate-binding protein
VKLKAALQVPVSELFIGQSLAQFKKEVEGRTRNAISIEIFDDGKPCNDAQIVGAVTSGAMELGVAGFNQFADKLPAVDILEQPFLLNFDALINAAFASDGELRVMIEKGAARDDGRARSVVATGWQSGVFFQGPGCRGTAADQG